MRRVEVVAYDPAWPEKFEREAKLITKVAGHEIVALHHIGSTSVPGLAAKPIIDIMIEVQAIEGIDALNNSFAAIGYTPKGEFGIPGRRYFIKGTEEVHSCHLHVFVAGNLNVKRHLLFRDYLRTHHEEAAEYGRLKEGLARRFRHDIDGYCNGKEGFIKKIDRRAEELK